MPAARDTDSRLAHSKRELQILSLVRELGEATRLELAHELGVDKKTVSLIVSELLARSLITPAGTRESQAGRRQELFRVNGAHSNFVGLDLGATHIIGLLTDLGGDVLDRVYFEIRPGLPVELILEQMRTIGRSLVASALATAEVRAIGICVPGFVNPETGVSLVAENIPGWKSINIREIFAAELRRPIYLEDCSRAFGVAERWLGEGRQTRNFLALDLGHGIGMAMFLDGALYTGSGYKAGEIGHTVVRPDGPPCTCGKRGCLETLASGRGIARQAALGLSERSSDLLARLTRGNIESVTAQDVAIAASMNDSYAVGLLQRAGTHIGTALANAVNLLNPSLIVLGGGLVSAGKVLLDKVREALDRYTMIGISDDLEFRVSRLGVDASALGSALIAMDRVFAPRGIAGAAAPGSSALRDVRQRALEPEAENHGARSQGPHLDVRPVAPGREHVNAQRQQWDRDNQNDEHGHDLERAAAGKVDDRGVKKNSDEKSDENDLQCQ